MSDGKGWSCSVFGSSSQPLIRRCTLQQCITIVKRSENDGLTLLKRGKNAAETTIGHRVLPLPASPTICLFWLSGLEVQDFIIALQTCRYFSLPSVISGK